MSTHLNWGASYLVNDLYARFLNPEASQARLVALGRLASVVIVAFAAAASAQVTPIEELHYNDSQGYPLLIDQIVTVHGVVTVPTGVTYSVSVSSSSIFRVRTSTPRSCEV